MSVEKLISEFISLQIEIVSMPNFMFSLVRFSATPPSLAHDYTSPHNYDFKANLTKYTSPSVYTCTEVP